MSKVVIDFGTLILYNPYEITLIWRKFYEERICKIKKQRIYLYKNI